MISPSVLFLGILLPALIAGAVSWFCGRGRGEERGARPFLGALSLGLGYLIAHYSIVGAPAIPSSAVTVPAVDWIAWFVLGALLLAPLRGLEGAGRWVNALYVAFFCVLSFRFPLAHVLPNDLSGLAIRFALTLVMYVVWNSSDRLAERLRGPALPAAWAVAGTGIAVSALFLHMASIAQLTGAVCAGLGAVALVGLFDRGARCAEGVIAVALIVFAGALVNAAIYDLPRVAIVLFVVALVAPWVATRAPFQDRPLLATTVAKLAALVPTAIATYLAYRSGHLE
ncbi:MAG: hypothetical protein JNL28_15405 [Planctomycetes bacterium]|nr:hypothetical protein [Planctomycetota bacterium]